MDMRDIGGKMNLLMLVAHRRVSAISGIVFSLFSFVSAYSGGSGTAENPYQIATVSDWNNLMSTSPDWNKSFIMTADVNLQGVALTPVGIDWEEAFTGIFDGNNHIIRNVYLNNPSGDFIGLFGIIRYEGQVRNLGVENVNVTGNEYVGGLAGLYFSYYSLTNCYATGTVAGNSEVGGLVGTNAGFSPTTNCYATCAVSGDIYVGGFAGSNNQEPIVACHATGTVNGNDTVGGLVGDNQSCAISNSYATGKVTGNHYVGGLVGNNSYGLLDTCYSVGQVIGNIIVGGLTGQSVNGFYTASFWDVNTSGWSTSGGGTGKTTAEMKTLSTFASAGWDFVNTWDIGENQTYPFLRKHSIGDLNYDGTVDFLDFALFADHWLAGQ
jgi:hypothetical protein